jgi:hypothetical protein
MDRQNAEYPHLKGWARRSQSSFQPELPEIAEWDRLLQQLGLNDSQALTAINSGGEAGDRLCKFVWGGSRRFFVPETAIEAVRHRTVHQLIVPITDQLATAI